MKLIDMSRFPDPYDPEWWDDIRTSIWKVGVMVGTVIGFVIGFLFGLIVGMLIGSLLGVILL